MGFLKKEKRKWKHKLRKVKKDAKSVKKFTAKEGNKAGKFIGREARIATKTVNQSLKNISEIGDLLSNPIVLIAGAGVALFVLARR